MTTRMVDVAEDAGVSIKTVSRVLNNEPHVQDAMRDRVRASVKKLGYVPSTSARSLRGGRAYAIVLVTHAIRSSFVNDIQFGALTTCQALGYRVGIAMVDDATIGREAPLRAWLADLLRQGRPDGLVVVPPMANDPAMAAILAEQNLPVVRIGPSGVQPDRMGASLRLDDRAAAAEITEHLIALGHERIAFIRGKEDQDATKIRYAGFVDAMTQRGLRVDPDLVLQGTFEFESGLDGGARLLGSDHPPSAVFAANDDMAAGVVVAAHRAGLNLPTDLSVAGFDDSEIARKMWPNLTTIRQPMVAMGSLACEMLIEATGRSEVALASRMVPYELMVRGSTAPLKALTT